MSSCCLVCGHIWWNEQVERCARCGGLCRPIFDQDFRLMERRTDGMEFTWLPETDN